jgi:hypothetical protein
MMRKATVVKGVGLCAMAAFAVYICWEFRAGNYTRYPAQTVPLVTAIPKLGLHLKGFDATDIRYVRICEYRLDEYLVAGKASVKTVETILEQYKFSGTDVPDSPPAPIARVLKEFPGSATKTWSSKNWVWYGAMNKANMLIGFNPETGEFWASITIQHADY